MRRRKPDVPSDPEVVAVLRDEPELLPIAEAVRATLGARYQRRRRRLRLARLGVAALVSAAAVALAVSLPWNGGEAGIVDRALAALGSRGPVVHVVARAELPGQNLVELSSGRAIPERTEVEIWFDESRGLIHTIVRRDGVRVGDILGRAQATVSAAGPVIGGRSIAPRLDSALLGFATGYRAALANGRAETLGRRSKGRGTVELVEIPTRFGLRERIALDPVTLRPLSIEPLAPDGRPSGVESTVVRMETLPAQDANFRRPRARNSGPSGGAVTESRQIPLALARRTLAGALWAGPRLGELELRLVQRQTLVRSYPQGGGRRRPTRGLALVYGFVRNGLPDSSASFFQLQQSAGPEPAYGFLSGALRLEPLPPAGLLRLKGSSASVVWRGELRTHGLVLALTASSRALLLLGARSLAPIPNKFR